MDLNSGRIQIKDAKPIERRHRAGRVVYAEGETLEALRVWWEDLAKIKAETDHFPAGRW